MLPPRHSDAVHPWPDGQTLLDQARQLQQIAQAGGPQPMLRGKNLGLLQGGNDAIAARRFCDAARELGAHVAVIPSTFQADSTDGDVRDTARMLGRLYDAVECQGLPPLIVKKLADTSGIPVFDGLASPSHASAGLAEELAGGEPLPDRRRYVMQAVLLAAMS